MNRRPWTADETERLRAGYARGATVGKLANQLGRSVAAVNNKISALGIRGHRTATADGGFSDPGDNVAVDLRADAGEVVWTTSTPVRTIDDALAKAAIDTRVWAVDRSVVNSWEQVSKQPDGSVRKTPLWQVKVWLKRRAGFSRAEFVAQILKAVGSPRRSRRRPVSRPANGLLADLSIADHHFGKLAWAPEVGENYDVQIAADRYAAAASRLIADARDRKAARVLLPVGNDFYHVDRGTNTTTAGTPLDADGRWQKAFVAGVRCLTEAIREIREFAPVDVVVVPGNHDTERAFCLGVVLDATFAADDGVNVDNRPTMKKAYRHGETLLGFFHGHGMTTKRFAQLPNEMASLWPTDYADTTWREWQLGHLHSEREDVWQYRAVDTQGDVIVRVLPSLCGTDAWHFVAGYRSPCAAVTHYFDAKFGRVGCRTVTLAEISN